MTLSRYEKQAAANLLEYLDARRGRLLFAYERPYERVAFAVRTVATETGRDVEFLQVEEVSPVELCARLTRAEKFLCAYNPNYHEGLSEHVKVMVERFTTLSIRSYTLADLSAAFFDVFQATPRKIQELNLRLIRVLQGGRNLTITDPSGTNLTATLEQEMNWVNIDCFSEAEFDLACNLPVGEVATYSPCVEGEVFFTGALLGTIPIGRKYGCIREPIHLVIEDNRVTRIHTPNCSLQRDLEFCLYFDKYTHFVNEIALGTNDAVRGPLLGLNYKYEENRYGFHMGFGASLAQQNVKRLTPHHLDLIFDSAIVFLDGKLLFDGEYQLESFPAACSNTPLRIAQRDCCGMFSKEVRADMSGSTDSKGHG